ncbi:MAG: ammonium transporter [Bacillota bacterium]
MKKNVISMFLILIVIVCFPAIAFADNGSIDKGDTTFIMISAALVFFMIPGLALFYGGMSRKKNVLNTIMNVFIVIGIVSIQWVLFGYSLSFGSDNFSIIGGFDFLGFNNVGAEASGTIPHTVFAMYQMMFAIITAALITGAFAERMRFPAMIAFILLWTTLVYDPLAHWVWAADGWLFKLGALDFAGGTVVHISSGIAGLVAAIIIGKRKGFGKVPIIPHNLTLVVIGTGILWFGWFGFNAGSALAANGLAANAFLVTNTSAAAGLLSWVLIEWMYHGKPTVLGAASGAVVGLVAITPAAGFVSPLSAIIIGLLVSPLCYFAISVLKPKLGYDDSLDAFGCHGIGGIWGAIATGLFASEKVNPNGANGLFFGNPSLLWTQIISVVATIALSGIFTFVILKTVSLFTKLRVTEKEEDEGLDLSLHGEDAYPDFSPEEGIAL